MQAAWRPAHRPLRPDRRRSAQPLPRGLPMATWNASNRNAMQNRDPKLARILVAICTAACAKTLRTIPHRPCPATSPPSETAKHRTFQFLDVRHCAGQQAQSASRWLTAHFHLGVLSSQVHVAWALAAGSRLGVGNDPRLRQNHAASKNSPSPPPAPSSKPASPPSPNNSTPTASASRPPTRT